jgi:hypothetical protein
MQSELVGLWYETSRWLALSGLSLVLFFLVLIDFPFLGTLVVQFYSQKSNSTQAYTRHKHYHNQYHTIREYQKQTSLESKQDFIRF